MLKSRGQDRRPFLNKAVCEALLKSGWFDSYGSTCDCFRHDGYLGVRSKPAYLNNPRT